MFNITNKAVLLEWPDTGALTSVDLLKERIHTGEEVTETPSRFEL